MVIGEDEVKTKEKKKKEMAGAGRRSHIIAIFLEAGVAELLVKLGV